MGARSRSDPFSISMLSDLDVDVLEDVEIAVPFVDVAELDHQLTGGLRRGGFLNCHAHFLRGPGLARLRLRSRD